MHNHRKGTLLATVAAAAMLAALAPASAQSGSRNMDSPRAQDSGPISGAERGKAKDSAGKAENREETRGEQGRAAQSPKTSPAGENTGQAQPRESPGMTDQGRKDRASQKTRDQQENSGQASERSKDASERSKGEADRAGTSRSERTGKEQRSRPERAGSRERDRDVNRGQRERATESASEPRSGTRQSDETDRSQVRGERNRAQDRDRSDSATQGRVQGETGGASASFTLDERQETRVRDTILKHKPRARTDVNFSVSVGATVPRRVHLETLPRDVVEIAPRYRGYKYVVVRDEIVIVDPKSYKVVTVIDRRGGATTGSKPRGERLTLTSAQREIVRRHATRRGERAADVELSVGAVIPSSVELYSLPEEVYVEVPELRRYRYVVIEDEVVLVDPDEHRIVEVIE